LLANLLALIALALSIMLGVRLWGRSRALPSGYNAELAWLRAGLYFCACFLISRATGVLPALLGNPLATAEQLADPNWLAFTALCFAVVFTGYYMVWPRGTLTHDRVLHWPAVISFGLLWGVSEGQLFLSVWAIAERFVTSRVIVAIVTFLALSAFIGVWHARFWDLHIAPEHNLAEWNARKVLFAHFPNLVVTLTYLAVYGNLGIFVLFQTLALFGSTYFMRFPPYPGR
jgi:hypothetical protein